MEENKDAIIEQQWRIIRDQHHEIVGLRERVEKHELIYIQPFDFLLWKLFHQVWPFSLLWR